MLKFGRSCCNGVQDLIFIHGFRQLVLYSTSISTEVNPKFVNYLVENLGFSKQQALSTSSKFRNGRKARSAKEVSDFNLVKNTASIIAFFKEIGLQHSHIKNAITFNPRILMSNVEQTLTPKTDALRKLGFSESDIAEVISVNPSLLLAGLNTTIIPAVEALKEIMDCEANHVTPIIKKLRCYNLSSITRCMVPNVAFLRSYGVALDLIRKFLPRKPCVFLRNPDLFRSAVTSVEKNLGIPTNAPHFLIGAEILNSLKEKTIESKRQVYKSFGWTDSDIAMLVSSNPCSILISEVSIRKKLDFFMNEMGYEPSYLASRSLIFNYSLDKRVVPRHKLLVILKDNGLINKNFALYTALTYSEPQFRKKFVLPFELVHEFYSKHAGVSLEMLTSESEKYSSSVV